MKKRRTILSFPGVIKLSTGSENTDTVAGSSASISMSVNKPNELLLKTNGTGVITSQTLTKRLKIKKTIKKDDVCKVQVKQGLNRNSNIETLEILIIPLKNRGARKVHAAFDHTGNLHSKASINRAEIQLNRTAIIDKEQLISKNLLITFVILELNRTVNISFIENGNEINLQDIQIS